MSWSISGVGQAAASAADTAADTDARLAAAAVAARPLTAGLNAELYGSAALSYIPDALTRAPSSRGPADRTRR